MAWGGQSVTIAWNAGLGFPGAGYYLYYGGAPATFSDKIDVGTNTSFTVSGLQAGATYYFVTTAYNVVNIESAPSNEASFIVPPDPVTQPPGPEIQVINPGSAAVGQPVTLFGTNFGTVSSVQFQGISATFSTVSNSVISATVPSGATSGTLSITTQFGTASSFFAVVPSAPPANDDFVNAAVLQGAFASLSANTSGASKEPGEPNHAGKAGGKSIWYRWTAPTNGPCLLDTSGSDFSTLMAVYTGNSLTTLSTVASNAISGGKLTNSLTFNATAGLTYRIAVDGLSAAGGEMVLRLMPAISTTTIYSSSFEVAEGYAANQPTAGKNGWLITGPGGSAIVDSALPGYGQQASIGSTSTKPLANSFLYRPLNYAVDASGHPLVKFSVLMQVNNPLGRYRDVFGWVVRNASGKTLFEVLFSNSDSSVNFQLGDGPGTIGTGVIFANTAIYQLIITMDFSRNRWSASLGGVTVATEQPMTTTGAAMTLGDIDATWILYNPSLPSSDNMVFDNYTVTAGPGAVPKLLVGPQNQTVAAGSTVTLAAVASGSSPLSYHWYYESVLIPNATSATLTLAGVAQSQSGKYSVLISNPNGSATGNAVLTVVTPPPQAFFVNPGYFGSNGMGLNLALTVGNDYRLQASTNFIAWSTLYDFHAAGTNLVCYDPASTNFDRRFYRVVSP